MKRTISTIVVALLFVVSSRAQEVTGLSDWSIFLDPGHGGSNQNVGVFGYSEANKVLGIGLELRQMLQEETDVGAVHMSRTADITVSLSQRVDMANRSGADFFHSIHSNAGGPTANSVFVLWPQYRDGREVVPNGGKAMAEIMGPNLGRAMRIPWIGTSGGFGECDFYGVSSCRSDNATNEDGWGKGGSRNYVQSYTNMASALSEAGFHTNPTQNQRNMNAQWKRLEARAIFWSYLDYHGIERPDKRVVTGIVYDADTGLPINGAVVSVGEREYTTDTYESLFHRYSNDPGELRNGFYYFEDVPEAFTITATAEDYRAYDSDVTTEAGWFTFEDIVLVSTLPPQVATASPELRPDDFRVIDPIVIDFTRRMDPASTEAAVSIEPDVEATYQWSNNNLRLTIRPTLLDPETTYTVTIAGTAVGEFGDGFDGDGDGEPGGDYAVTFTTGPEDVTAPQLIAGYPVPRGRDVHLNPVLSYTYDEWVNAESVDGRLELRSTVTNAPVTGSHSVERVGELGVVHFYPEEELAPEHTYVLDFAAGITDIFGNETLPFSVLFTTGDSRFIATSLDNFEGTGNSWWEPQQSGSTIGIVTDSTGRTTTTTHAVQNTGDTSMQLRYGWAGDAGSTLIRLYLAPGSAGRAVNINTNHRLQAHVFGDGSDNRIRFVVHDGSGYEASPWYTIDWAGWRLVSWDLSGEVVAWVNGDGVISGNSQFDSIQMSRGDGGAAFGTVYVDNLRIATVEQVGTSAPVAEIPASFGLGQNYPNPFNPATTIPFELASTGPVTIKVFNALGAEVGLLVTGSSVPAGKHEVTWDASAMPSGVYFVRMEAGNQTFSQKLVLLK